MFKMFGNQRKSASAKRPERSYPKLVKLAKGNGLTGRDPLVASLELSRRDISSGNHRLLLYRFLADSIPIISSCIWTWSRLAAASGRFLSESDSTRERAVLNRLEERIATSLNGKRSGLTGLLPELFTYLFRDGCAGGFLILTADGRSVDRFQLVDPADLRVDSATGKLQLVLENLKKPIELDRTDFSLLTLGDTHRYQTGRSILQPIPFVSYIEQQLVDDMRRASHNSGYHRLHVKVTPPERYGGESDPAYVNRINEYFDSTVKMIKSCEVDENPVTWNNVEIEYIGPENSRSVTNSWFMHHRAMVEEIAAGTNLAPFLLGYSYGATTTWSGFKFDLVMRQVRTVQAEAARLLEWIGNVELALQGFRGRCRFEFDNSFSYRANDTESIRASRVDSVLKLYQAGLIDEKSARRHAEELL